MNPRKFEYIMQLADTSFPLIMRANEGSIRYAKAVCKLGFVLALFGIFSRHGDSDSQLGATR